MNKINIIVEARMGSHRLPGKTLLEIMNKPILELMIERLKNINLINEIIIATTTNKEDDLIENIANKTKVKCFRGSENDVLKRVYDAARFYITDIVVEITGDTPCIDPDISNNIISFYLKNYKKYDFVSNDIGFYDKNYKIEFPLGFSTKVFNFKLLKEVNLLAKDEYYREHVVSYIIKNHEKYSIYNFPPKDVYKRNDFRLTLDYLDDYKLINIVYENLYPNKKNFSAIDIINFLDSNPELKKINSKYLLK